MNNWIIVIPSLLSAALGVGGVAYGAWQGQNAKAEALLANAKDFQALQAENKRLDIHDTMTETYADGLEQELEWITEERDEARLQLDTLNRENDKLHAQVKLLVETLNTHVGEEESNEAPLATNSTQDSAKARPVRNAQKRAGTPRKEH